MAQRTLPGLGLSGYDDYLASSWQTWADPNWRSASLHLQARAKSRVTSLPGTPSLLDIYIVPSGDANGNNVAVWDGAPASEAWVYFTPVTGWKFYVDDEAVWYRWNGSAWINDSLRPEVFDVGDETTTITTGTGKKTFRAPFNGALYEVRASLATASAASGPVAVDVNIGGVSVFSTTLTIDDTEKTSETAVTASALTSTPLNFSEDDEFTIDIDTAGSGAAGLKVTLFWAPRNA